MDTLEEVVSDAIASKVFGWDLECESKTGNPNDAKNPRLARITHVAIASPKYAGCWDVSEEVLSALVKLLTSPIYAFVHNMSYDHAVLHHEGVLPHKKITAKAVDTLGLVWLLDEEDRHGLKHSVWKYNKIKMTEFNDVVKNSRWAKKLDKIQSELAFYDKVIKGWTSKTPKRPYPKFSDEPKSRTAIRKDLRTADPSLKASEAKTLVEELFTEEHLKEYEDWVLKKKEKYQADIDKCKEHINEHMKKYARDDARNLLKLYNKIIKLIREEGTEHVIPIEMAVRMETIDMEIHGMPVDPDRLEEIGKPLREVSEEFANRVYDIAKKEFNINSPVQIRELIYDELGVTPPTMKVLRGRNGSERHIPAFTSSGDKVIQQLLDDGRADEISKIDARDMDSIPEELRPFLVCDAKALERIDHEIGQAILDYRTATKLLNTYVDSIIKRLEDSGEHIVHGSFNCWGTKTGRFSSKDPNLQNIPSRGKGGDYHELIQSIGPKIRYAFVAPPPDEISPEGYCLLVSDHSQIELRIIAHVSDDPKLISVYRENVEVNGMTFYTGDVHSRTAQEVGCKRKDAKSINFGFNYGMGPEKYAQQNRVFIPGTKDYDIETCTTFRDGFFNTYRGIKRLMDHVGELYQKGQRKFPTLAGRYRHVYSADRNPSEFPPTKGTLLNYIVQGSAGDLLKYVIYIVRKYLYPRYPGLQLIGQVHDEVIYVVPNRYKEEIGLLIKFAMEYPWYPLKVPILSSAKLSDSWGAKDDDTIAEIGTFYAKINGEPRLFTEKNWDEYLAADEAGLVEEKSACAQLTDEQIRWCRTIIPAETPPTRKSEKKRVMSRAEMKTAGLI